MDSIVQNNQRHNSKHVRVGEAIALGNPQRTEIKRQSIETHYRLLFESNPNPMWLYDPATLAFLEVNQAAIDRYGYSESEFLAMTIADIRPTSEVPKLIQATLDIVPGQPHTGIWKHRKQDNTLFDVKVTAHAFEVDGKQVNLATIEDITALQQLQADRQQAQTDLSEAHRRIISVWENMTDAYVTLDRDWRVVYANQAAINVITHLAKIETAEIYQKTHWEIFPDLAGGIVEARYQQAVTDRIPVHFEVFYEPTGNWFEIHAYPSESGLGVYFRDISEAKRDEVVRKLAEGQLLRTEARLRYLLCSNPAILYACEASGNYAATFISENVAVMLGYQSQDFLADPKFWANQIHPEDVERVFAGLTHLFEVGTHTHEYRFRHRDGRYRWVLDELKLIRDAAGDPVEIVGYWIDITDRKQAEQKIREQANLLAIATDAIVVHDLDNRILFWNQGAEKLYGWKSAEILGQDWRQLLDLDVLAELATGLDRVVRQGAWQGEVEKIARSGKSVVVMSRCSLMLDEAGQPKSILTVDTDITEQKHLELQFLRAQRLESLGMLASGIAHDLNNVLTPIIGLTQLLPIKLPHLDAQTQKLLQVVDESAQRGAGLVKQILAFTRGIEGKPTTTQVSHLLAETRKIIHQTFPKNIELSIDLPPDLWSITADATMLHQVFMNLCVNARDAMPDGGTLTIGVENLAISQSERSANDENYARMHIDAQVGTYVLVTISDTGTGIPPELIDRIFDPFFTTKEIGKGTGLGLSTVIGIVKSHHGLIDVDSQVGKGTRFKVYLPATDTSEPIIIDDVPPPIGRGELILVVDDEIAIREITKTTLETHGYRVITASDGIEAIALYAEHKQEIAIVLLDMMMPLLDSETIIKTLSRLDPQVQIIIMSGLTTHRAVANAIDGCVKAFVAKPFTATELLKLLSDLCDRVDRARAT